jgi:hypothetical protein
MHPRELPGVDVVVVPALGTMTAEDTLGALAARASRVPAAGRRGRGFRGTAGRSGAGCCRPVPCGGLPACRVAAGCAGRVR